MNTPTSRLETLKAIRELFPDLSTTEAMRLTSWADTGVVDLDPARIERAASVLMTELGHDRAGREVQAQMRGVAQRVLIAYYDKNPS